MSTPNQPQWPPPPPPPPPQPMPARPKPFFDTTLGGIAIAVAVLIGIVVLVYVTQYAGDDGSTTVECISEGNSTSCTRY